MVHEPKKYCTSSRSQTHMVCCENDSCFLTAHNVRPKDTSRQIFGIPEFDKLSCFEIAHSPQMQGFFTKLSSDTQRYSIKRGHPVYKRLRSVYDAMEAEICQVDEENSDMESNGSDSGDNQSDREDGGTSSSSDWSDSDSSGDDGKKNNTVAFGV